MIVRSIVIPIINNNGATAESYIEARITARQKIRDLMAALSQIKPHGRDYQTACNPDAYRRDTETHNLRMLFLDQLYNDMEEEMEQIQKQQGE